MASRATPLLVHFTPPQRRATATLRPHPHYFAYLPAERILHFGDLSPPRSVGCRSPPSSPKSSADELVDWLNKADATYRTELRDINELNFARFAAQVDQRFAEQDAKWELRIAHLETRLIRWMVGLGLTGFGITIGVLIALLKLWTG